MYRTKAPAVPLVGVCLGMYANGVLVVEEASFKAELDTPESESKSKETRSP